MAHRNPLGVDEHQARARRAAGLPMPRETTPKQTEKLVEGIIAVTCDHCGGTTAKVPGQKIGCPFCGRKL